MPQPAPTPPAAPPSLKDMILGALAAVGGQAYLERQAKENPRQFLTLLGKVLAAELRPKTGKQDAPKPGPIHVITGVPDADDPSLATPDTPSPDNPQADGRTPARPSGTPDLPPAPPEPAPTASPRPRRPAPLVPYPTPAPPFDPKSVPTVTFAAPRPRPQSPATRDQPLPDSLPLVSPYHVPPHKIYTNLPDGHHPVNPIRPPPPPPPTYPF